MSFQPGAMVYTQGFGSRPENVEVPHYDSRIPTTTDINYPIGKWWLYVGHSLWYLLNLSTSNGVTSANWIQVSDSDGPVESVTGTANQITVVTAAGVATASLPNAVTAPGSLTTTTSLAAGTTVTAGTGVVATTGGVTASAGNIVATLGNISSTAGSVSAGTSVTAGTTVTATLGDVTASNGNFVGSTSGTGIFLTSPSNTGAAPGPVVVNGRSGRATFTGVSIAGGADLTLSITNSSVTTASTIVLVSMSGATTGAALCIKSLTSAVGSLVITVTNGTGATTSIADIQIDFLVVNA